MIRVSAPGKLFLVGEYAVLDGAPALLSAVDRRVHVTIGPSPDRHWYLHAADIGVDTLRLRADGRLPRDLDPARRARLRLYETVLDHVCEHFGTPAGALTIRIDSKAFACNGYKFGLGSSAAVAATLTAALVRAAGREPDRDALCHHAASAHRQAQGGYGSGADVAACIHGGVIEYRAGTVQAEPVWPAGITGMAVVTGDGASTPDLVARVRAYAKRDPAAYAADMNPLRTLATCVHDTVADAAAFLALTRDYFAALQTLDRHAGAGIVLPRHRELAALAARHDGVFKTSGAGGGDLGLAFACSGAPARRLATALEKAEAKILPLRFAAPGILFD